MRVKGESNTGRAEAIRAGKDIYFIYLCNPFQRSYEMFIRSSECSMLHGKKVFLHWSWRHRCFGHPPLPTPAWGINGNSYRPQVKRAVNLGMSDVLSLRPKVK